MNLATKNNERIIATPKDKATCPLCNQEVIAKCGSIKIWHWSHKSKINCDSFGECETKWHLNWKNEFPIEQQEFIMGRHKADIRTSSRFIIELQNSPISSEEIKDREDYYKRMVWLLNGSTLCKGLELRNKKNRITFRWKHPPKSWWNVTKQIYIDLNPLNNDLYKRKEYIEKKLSERFIEEKDYFNHEKVFGEDEQSLQIHLDIINENIKENKDKIFLIKRIYKNIPCGGWGEIITKQKFLNKFKGVENGIK